MTNSDWSYDALFAKAQVYMERALLADRNGTLFPFWASLALELLGRATLSKIHPSLIADPREGNNILHALGYSLGKELPKTIGAKTVFLRLQIIVPAFTQADEKFCQSFINMRNEELHTGTPIFENYSTNAWLTNYYRSIKILLEFQDKSLKAFLGFLEAAVAEEMIAGYNEALVKTVNERIKKYRDVFDDLDANERVEKKALAKTALRAVASNYNKRVKCPACKEEALLVGKVISQNDPKINDDVIVISSNILPVAIKCLVCGFKLEGHGELSVAELGGQFAANENFDPIDFYAIQTDDEAKENGLEEYPDFDYGND